MKRQDGNDVAEEMRPSSQQHESERLERLGLQLIDQGLYPEGCGGLEEVPETREWENSPAALK